MGMSSHVVGFKPPDDKWKKMKKVWDACVSAGISIPEDVMEFFNHEAPDDRGVGVEIEELDCVREYREEGHQGFEVTVRELPKDVTVIRFYNAF